MKQKPNKNSPPFQGRVPAAGGGGGYIFLHQAGILVLRFENQVVFNHPVGLLAQIKQHFSRNQEPPRPSGTPP